MNKLQKFISSLTMVLHRRKNPNHFSVLESLGYAIIDGEWVELAPRSKLIRFLMGYPLRLPSPARTNPVGTIGTPDDHFFADSEDDSSQSYPEMDDVTRDNLTKIHDYLEEHPTVISKLYDRLQVAGSEDCSHPVNKECPDERDKSINRHGNGLKENQSQPGSAPNGMGIHKDGQNG